VLYFKLLWVVCVYFCFFTVVWLSYLCVFVLRAFSLFEHLFPYPFLGGFGDLCELFLCFAFR